MALQLTSFACLGILSEIAASSTLRKISCGACVTHGSLNARQSDNFIESTFLDCGIELPSLILPFIVV